MHRGSGMHLLIATTGAMSPAPVVGLVERLLRDDDSHVTVLSVIEVPHTFLDEISAEEWHPLEQVDHVSTEEALIARYVEERGRKHTEQLQAALRAGGIGVEPLYLEGEDPAKVIVDTAQRLDVDLVLLGATRLIFDATAWESVSARVMVECGKPVLVVPAARRPAVEPVEDEAE